MRSGEADFEYHNKYGDYDENSLFSPFRDGLGNAVYFRFH